MKLKRVMTGNVRAILANLADLAEESGTLCDDIEAFLDYLTLDDAFGTEAQLDPRGDRRD